MGYAVANWGGALMNGLRVGDAINQFRGQQMLGQVMQQDSSYDPAQYQQAMGLQGAPQQASMLASQDSGLGNGAGQETAQALNSNPNGAPTANAAGLSQHADMGQALQDYMQRAGTAGLLSPQQMLSLQSQQQEQQLRGYQIQSAQRQNAINQRTDAINQHFTQLSDSLSKGNYSAAMPYLTSMFGPNAAFAGTKDGGIQVTTFSPDGTPGSTREFARDDVNTAVQLEHLRQLAIADPAQYSRDYEAAVTEQHLNGYRSKDLKLQLDKFGEQKREFGVTSGQRQQQITNEYNLGTQRNQLEGQNVSLGLARLNAEEGRPTGVFFRDPKTGQVFEQNVGGGTNPLPSGLVPLPKATPMTGATITAINNIAQDPARLDSLARGTYGKPYKDLPPATQALVSQASTRSAMSDYGLLGDGTPTGTPGLTAAQLKGIPGFGATKTKAAGKQAPRSRAAQGVSPAALPGLAPSGVDQINALINSGTLSPQQIQMYLGQQPFPAAQAPNQGISRYPMPNSAAGGY